MKKKRLPLLLVCVFLCIGTVLRLGPMIHIDPREDELFSLMFASSIRDPISQLIQPIDDRPPFFYLILMGLLKLTRDPILLRTVSLYSSLACTVLAYFVFRRTSQSLAVIAAGLVTLSPFFIEYGWQIRDYGVLLPVSLLSGWCALLWLDTQISSNKKTVLLSLLFFCNLFGSFFNYVYLFFIVSQLIALSLLTCVFDAQKKFLSVLYLWLAHAVIFVIMGGFLVNQHHIIRMTTEWVPSINLRSVDATLATANGLAFSFQSNLENEKEWRRGFGLGSLAFVVSGLLLTYYKRRTLPEKIRNAIWLGTLIIVCNVVLVWATSELIDRSLFVLRTMLPAAVVYTLSLAALIYVVYITACEKKVRRRVFVILSLIWLGFYLRAYLDLYPFIVGDPTLQYRQTQRSMLHYLRQQTAKTQFIFLPIYYQELYLSVYFEDGWSKRNKVFHHFQQQIENNEAYSAPQEDFQRIIVVASQAVLDADTGNELYGDEQMRQNLELLHRVQRYCGKPLTTVLTNHEISVLQCD